MAIIDFLNEAEKAGYSKDEARKYLADKIDNFRADAIGEGFDPDEVENKIQEKFIGEPTEFSTSITDFAGNVGETIAAPFKAKQPTEFDQQPLNLSINTTPMKPTDIGTVAYPDAVTIPEYSPITEGAKAAFKAGSNVITGLPTAATGFVKGVGQAVGDIGVGAAQLTAEAGKQAAKTVGLDTSLFDMFQKKTEQNWFDVKNVANKTQKFLEDKASFLQFPTDTQPKVVEPELPEAMRYELKAAPSEDETTGRAKFLEAAKGLALMPYESVWNTISMGRNAIYYMTGDEAYGPNADQRDLVEQMKQNPSKVFVDTIGGLAPLVHVVRGVRAKIADETAPIKISDENIMQADKTFSRPVNSLNPYEVMNERLVIEKYKRENPEAYSPDLDARYQEITKGSNTLFQQADKVTQAFNDLTEQARGILKEQEIPEVKGNQATRRSALESEMAKGPQGIPDFKRATPEQPANIAEKATIDAPTDILDAVQRAGITTKNEVIRAAKTLFGQDISREQAGNILYEAMIERLPESVRAAIEQPDRPQIPYAPYGETSPDRISPIKPIPTAPSVTIQPTESIPVPPERMTVGSQRTPQEFLNEAKKVEPVEQNKPVAINEGDNITFEVPTVKGKSKTVKGQVTAKVADNRYIVTDKDGIDYNVNPEKHKITDIQKYVEPHIVYKEIPDFGVTILDSEATADNLIKSGEPIVLKNSMGQIVTITPSTKGSGKFQWTAFDKRGPVMDSTGKDLKSTVADALENGFTQKSSEKEFIDLTKNTEQEKIGQTLKKVSEPIELIESVPEPVFPKNKPKKNEAITTNQDYYKSVGGGKSGVPHQYIKVKGTPIKIDAMPNIEFFLERESAKKYRIREAKTGLSAAFGETPEAVIKEMNDMTTREIRPVTEENALDTIKNHLKQYPNNPRLVGFTPEIETNAMGIIDTLPSNIEKSKLREILIKHQRNPFVTNKMINFEKMGRGGKLEIVAGKVVDSHIPNLVEYKKGIYNAETGVMVASNIDELRYIIEKRAEHGIPTYSESQREEIKKKTGISIGLFGAGTLQNIWDYLTAQPLKDMTAGMDKYNRLMYEKKRRGEVKMEDIRKTAEGKEPTFADGLRSSLMSTWYPAIKRMKEAKVYDKPYAENPLQYSLDDLNMKQTMLEAYVKRQTADIWGMLAASGEDLNIAKYDNYVDAKNALDNRGHIVNPYSDHFYKKIIDSFTPAQKAVMDKIQAKFFENRKEYVIDLLESTGREGAFLANLIKTREGYVTMKSQNILEKEFQKTYGEASGEILKAKGMTGANMSVVESTILKDMAIISSALMTEAKSDLADFMRKNFPADIKQPSGNQFKTPPPGYENMTYKQNGKDITVQIPKDLAQMFDNFSNQGAGTALGKFNNIFKKIWIDWSPVFKIRNFTRDTWAATYQMPGLWNTIKQVWHMNPLAAALDSKNPWRTVFRVMFGMEDEQYNKMIKNGMLMPDTDYADMQQQGISALERVQKRFKAETADREKSILQKVAKPITGIANLFAILTGLHPDIGKALENVNKVAAFRTLEKSGMHMKELAYLIRRIGSPAFMEKGNLMREKTLTSIAALKDMAMFVNPAIQGFRADKYFFKKDPLLFTAKVIGSLAAPSIALALAMQGDKKEMYNKIPDYDLFNYFNLVYGQDQYGNPLYFKLPIPQSFKPIHRMITLSGSQNPDQIKQLASNLLDEFPALTPFFNMAGDITSLLVSNEPPQDIMGRNAIDPNVWKGKDKVRKGIAFAKYLSNQYGFGGLMRFNLDPNQEQKSIEQATSELLEPLGLSNYSKELSSLVGYAVQKGRDLEVTTTKIPVVGSFFTKGTQGFEKAKSAAYTAAQSEQAERTLQRESGQEKLKRKEPLTPEERKAVAQGGAKSMKINMMADKIKNTPDDIKQFKMELYKASKTNKEYFKQLYKEGLRRGLIKRGGQ